jgi:uncharacterized protein YidB (DUF937 family)
MGLLDSLLSGMAQQGGGQSEAATNPLLQIALQLLTSSGGLSGLAQQFQQAGLGPQMGSWISTGQNLSISPDQLLQALGQGRMQEMAAGTGMDMGQLSGGLSDLLPQLVDRLTPQGQIPAAGVDDALAELSRMMPR